MRLLSFVRSNRRSLLVAGAVIAAVGLGGGAFLTIHLLERSRLRKSELADVATARGMLKQGKLWDVQTLLTRDGRPHTAEGACVLASSHPDPAKALPYVRQALEFDPENREALQLLYGVYGLLRRQAPSAEQRGAILREEIVDFGRIPTRHPQFTAVLLHSAMARMEFYGMEADAAQLDAAKSELARAVKLAESGEDWKLAARIHYQFGRAEVLGLSGGPPERKVGLPKDTLAASNEHFRAAARLDPDLVDAWAELARNLRRTGQIPVATEELEAAAGRTPSPRAQVRLWALLSSLHAENRDLANAGRALRKCIAADPALPGGYLTLANLSVTEGKPEQAEEILRQVLERFPGLVEAHIQLARLYVESSRAGEGIRLLEHASSLPPAPSLIPGDTNGARARAVAGGFLARVYLEKSKDLPRALKAANTAAHLAPPDATLVDTIAWIRYQMGERHRARMILERLLDRGPQLAVAKYHLAVILESLGDREAAVRRLDEVAELPDRFPERPEAEQMRKRLAGLPR